MPDIGNIEILFYEFQVEGKDYLKAVVFKQDYGTKICIPKIIQ